MTASAFCGIRGERKPSPPDPSIGRVSGSLRARGAGTFGPDPVFFRLRFGRSGMFARLGKKRKLQPIAEPHLIATRPTRLAGRIHVDPFSGSPYVSASRQTRRTTRNEHNSLTPKPLAFVYQQLINRTPNRPPEAA